MENNNYQNNYQNNPKSYYKKGGLWKWIIIYLIVAVIVYGIVYYIIMMMRGGYSYTPQQYQYNNTPTQVLGTSQDLNSASNELDVTNVNQIDTGLNQNDSDAKSF